MSVFENNNISCQEKYKFSYLLDPPDKKTGNQFS